MPMVFGRHHSGGHPYANALATSLRATELGDRAMALNMMYDHRVSVPREAALRSLGSGNRSPTDMQDELVDYFDSRVRTRTLPDYVYQSLNGDNIVLGGSSARRLIHKDYLLTRALDLSGLGPVFQAAKLAGHRAFAGFHGASTVDVDATTKWLDGELLARSDVQVRQFIRATLEVLNWSRARRAFQPTWVTSWSAFEPHVNQPPERWLELLGMNRPFAPIWVIMLAYPARIAAPVVRPTQLDAGWYAYHFPSPPQAPLAVGGHPMDLQYTPATTALMPEYIHKQIDHTLEHWENANRLCGRTTRPTIDALDRQRKAHFALLASVYGKDVCAWMPRCI
jgi:hypothetical protein